MKTLIQYRDLPPVPMILYSTEEELMTIGRCDDEQKEKMKRFVELETKETWKVPQRCQHCPAGVNCYQLHTALHDGILYPVMI